MRGAWYIWALALGGLAPVTAEKAPELKAIEYLAHEVPRWKQENDCFSCHNNGDGARALYSAVGVYPVPLQELTELTEWLATPGRWDHNPGDPRFSDKRLARIQFAATLASAARAGTLAATSGLVQAAELLLADQEEDGAWQVEAEGTVGSPVTWGTSLATARALQVLRQADSDRFGGPIRKAESWLRGHKLRNILDAAAVLQALAPCRDPFGESPCTRALDLIRSSQASDGGWGPYPRTRSENFDTAVAVLALSALPSDGATSGMIERGRRYLLGAQLPEGGWLETTRPPGGDSYAQHISTTAWATLALLETRR